MSQGKAYRYFSKIAGSLFHFPDGHSVQFSYGFFDLKESDYEDKYVSNNKEDPRNGRRRFDVYKEELDALIKAGNPLLYIQGQQPEPLPNVNADKNAVPEAKLAEQQALERNIQGKETGDLNKGAPMTGVNESTVDPVLQQQLLKPAANSAADRIAALKAAAAAKNGQVQ